MCSKISSLNSRSFSSFLPPFEGSLLSTAAFFFSLNSAAFRCLFFSLNSAAFRCPFSSLNSAACFFATSRFSLFLLLFAARYFRYLSLLPTSTIFRYSLSAASLAGLKCHNLSLLQLYKGMFLMPFSLAITNWITLMFSLRLIWLVIYILCNYIT